jgi:DNA end-binding protein Ku
MAPRANWKGFIKVGELTIPVALYTAASASERIALHTLNRNTGHRVRRQFVDEASGKTVPNEDQVKGYEVGQGEYVMLEPDEVAAATPESDKTLSIEAFIKCSDLDDIYLDRPYYLAPTNPVAGDAFGLLREGLRSKKVAALAKTVLFRRVRTLLIAANGEGLLASTLNFDYEVRAPQEAFGDIPQLKVKGEMMQLAKHIIETKRGVFDPREFNDRYEAAVAELVRAKLDGKPIAVRKARTKAKVVDLMEALRQSAGTPARKPATGKGKARPASTRVKRATTKGQTGTSHRRKAS